MKKCPCCTEEIPEAAVQCEHCNAALEKAEQSLDKEIVEELEQMRRMLVFSK